MQPDPVTHRITPVAVPAALPEMDQVGIQIVMCDEAGRPRSGRLLRLSACLAGLPPMPRPAG